jgi:hypothetical protein
MLMKEKVSAQESAKEMHEGFHRKLQRSAHMGGQSE